MRARRENASPWEVKGGYSKMKDTIETRYSDLYNM